MPRMSDTDRMHLLAQTQFLRDSGYSLERQNEYGFELIKGNIQFGFYYERYDNDSDISIRFLKENKVFSVGWIAVVTSENMTIDINRAFENLSFFCDYLERNLELVTDITFCQRMDFEIEQYIKNKQQAHSC